MWTSWGLTEERRSGEQHCTTEAWSYQYGSVSESIPRASSLSRTFRQAATGESLSSGGIVTAMNRSPRTTIAARSARSRSPSVSPRPRRVPPPPRRPPTTSRSPSRSGRATATGARGTHDGTVALPVVAGVTMLRPAGTTDYADPHTGDHPDLGLRHLDLAGHARSASTRASWSRRGTRETPAGTWIQVEMQGTYNTGDQTPWYVMGRWASGDGDIRRTSVNRQGDPWSTIWTDTFSIDDVANGVHAARLPAAPDPLPRARPVAVAAGDDARRDELLRAGPVHGHAERGPHRLGP